MEMTTMNRFLLVSFFLLSGSMAIKAQDTDFGIWYEVSGDYKIVKGLRFDLETSIRTDKNASNIKTFYLEPGLRYKFNDYFAAGIYYRFIEQDETIDKSEGIYELHPRHRWFIQLKGSLPVNRFTLSARYRFQEQFKTYIKNPEDEIPQWSHRFRLDLEYDIKGIPLTPYVNVEMHSLLFSSDSFMIDKWRYIAGAEYTVKKMHTFGLEYIFDTSKVTKPPYNHIICLKYGISL
jgi:opacity protein-like surface antigen